jgi:hypothetical protein
VEAAGFERVKKALGPGNLEWVGWGGMPLEV